MLSLLLACSTPAREVQAAAGERPRVDTNEGYIAEVTRGPTRDMSDPVAVLHFVLEALPDTVRVMPTENYYYFRFVEAGVPWAGSIRLGPAEREMGKVELSYYKDIAPWAEDMAGGRHEILGADQGVKVAAEEALKYRVTAKGRSVLFVLNDMSNVVPPAALLGERERFIGPVFDESGVRFFLVYNGQAKVFHYLLDETVPVADELVPQSASPRILVGRRTGFAYYLDQLRDRKILIGVSEVQSRLNTYFDGPFDQLPENFIKGEELRTAIVDADASAKGEIDRLGNYLKEEGRYLIHPYMLYAKPADLMRVHTCAASRVKRPDLYAKCFVIEPEGAALGPPPVPRK